MRGADLLLTLFSLALVVACVGYAYRYLTSSATSVYKKNLRQVVGPWADELLRSPLTADLRLRGPFQFTNIQPPRMQLPMSRDEFISAFERVVPGLYGEALAILCRQIPQQEWSQSPNNDWEQFIKRLKDEGEDSYEAKEILAVSERHGNQFSQIRSELWRLFPDVNDLISRYDGFLAKLDHANRRRTFRQLVVIAGLLTVCGNLSLSRLANIGVLLPGNVLFDTHIVQALPKMLWHREFVAVLGYFVSCLLPTVTIAGLADVLDRKLFGITWMSIDTGSSRETRSG